MTGKTNENIEIVVLAIYMTAGKAGWVHLEDIAIQADKIAPGKYRWEKHKAHLSDRIISSWLSDASKDKYGSLVVSRRKQARMNEEKLPKGLENDWRLTEAGVHLAERSQRKTSNQVSSTRVAEQKIMQKEMSRLLAEEAFAKYSAGRFEEITTYEIENFFRINEYILGEARKEKISRLKNMFSSDESVSAAINYLAAKLMESSHA